MWNFPYTVTSVVTIYGICHPSETSNTAVRDLEYFGTCDFLKT